MRIRLPLSAVIVFVAVSPVQAQSTDSTASRQKSVLAGVYTDEQATKGDAEHQTNCSACHGTENYAGEAFVKNWAGRTVFDLFDQLKTTMPEDNPGGLSAQQYTDVIAYILKINGLPAGAEVLPADPEALRLIKIEVKPPASPAQFGGRTAGPHRGVSLGSARLTRMHRPHVAGLPSARR